MGFLAQKWRAKRSGMETMKHERDLQRDGALQKRGLQYPWRRFEGLLLETGLAWMTARRIVHLVLSGDA